MDMVTTTRNPEVAGFAAFISYSHADEIAATKLQKRLETYRLPKSLVALNNDARLGKIFRDREDLAAAPSLSEAINSALSQSATLIVVCSPAAAKSKWVAEEIRLFRKLHPKRPILTALVNGSPADAFPAPLVEKGNEPLAADLQASGDGEQLGYLKIIAGIAAVPLDALVQRDAQRKLRRVIWITLAAGVAMLAMGIMTAFAISSRNEAQRQRASAEGLVEYMLTDLREELKGVGRIEVMTDVNQRAMQHYQSQGDLSSLPPESLERRARVLHAMGEDDNMESNYPGALAKFKEAHRYTAELLAQEPNNPDRIFAHAQSEYWVGRAHWDRDERESTTRHWQNYRALAAKLAEIEPDKVRSLQELAYAEGNLCELDVTHNFNLAGAETHCRSAMDFKQKALRKIPEDRDLLLEIADRHGWLATVQKAQKKFEASKLSRTKEAATIDRLIASAPRNANYRERRLAVYRGLAENAIASGNHIEARSIALDGVKSVETVLRQGANVEHLIDMRIRFWVIIAAAEKLSGKPWQASFEKSGTLINEHARKNPKFVKPAMRMRDGLWAHLIKQEE